MKTIKLKVRTQNRNYSILIGSNLLHNISNFLKENSISFSKCLFVIDKKIPKKFLKKIFSSMKNKKSITYYFNASEINKNQKNVDKILEILLKNNFHRDDCLISIGGGITGDVSGFAASIFKRGMKFVNIPTTLLAQVDSSIGGKTGINSNHGKNLIGAFHQPHLVISDISFLKTLPKREIICGYGEILKHSLIADKKFFLFLNKYNFEIFQLRTPYIEKAIYRSCLIKKEVVEKDEKEKNLRKILNFGHTFAHAFEASLGYSKKLNHGEAVILGMLTACKYSLNNKLLTNREFEIIHNHLINLKLPANIKNFFSLKNLKQIVLYMMKDKKNKSQKINLILLKKIGNPIYSLNFDKQKLSYFLKNQLTN